MSVKTSVTGGESAIASVSRSASVERNHRADLRPPTREALDLEPAVEGLDPVGEPAQARAAERIGTADAVVGDLDDGVAVGRVDPNACGRRLRVLGNVRQRLRDDIEGGGLDRSRQPSLRERLELDRD